MSEKRKDITFSSILVAAVLQLMVVAPVAASCILPKSCEEIRDCIGAPAYYCDCHAGRSAGYGLDTIISSPLWLKGKFSTFNEGFLAYWFSEDSLLIDAYAFCTSDTSSLSRVIVPDGSMFLSAREVAEKVGGNPNSSILDNLDVHLHIVPLGSSGGRITFFSGAVGAHSYCENPLLLVPRANYIFKDEKTVYRLNVKKRPSRSTVMRYRNDFDMSERVEMTINYGSCDGEVVARHVFTDSIKPYFLPLDVLMRAYEESLPLYVNFTKPASKYAANIYYRDYYKFVEKTVDTTLCIGKGLQLADTLLTQATQYIDTAFATNRFTTDTIFVTTYNLTMTDVEEKHTTVKIKGRQFPYVYNLKILNSYGDYRFEVHQDGECDYVEILHLEPEYTVSRATRDTTLCEGMIFEMGGKQLSRNGSLRDTTYSGKYLDEQLITTYNVRFTAPELEKDTVSIHADLMPYNYYGTHLTSYGTKTVTIRQKGECTRRVMLTVLENDGKFTLFRAEKDTAGCAVDGIQLSDTLLFASTIYIDTMYVNDTTVRITTWNVRIDEPGQLLNDTIALEDTDIPYIYNGFRVTSYGEYTIEQQTGECVSQTKLAVLPKYVFIDIDTTICQGQVFELNGKEYRQSAVAGDTLFVNRYTSQITRWHLTVDEAQVEERDIVLGADELPYRYDDDHEFGEQGVYDVIWADEEGCEHIVRLSLHVSDAVSTLTERTKIMPSLLQAGETVTFVCDEPSELTLSDATGRVVGRYTLESGKNELLISESGVLVATIKGKQTTTTQKLIVR